MGVEKSGIIYRSDWYVNDDGFKETLEEMADPLMEDEDFLDAQRRARLEELRAEIKKFVTPKSVSPR